MLRVAQRASIGCLQLQQPGFGPHEILAVRFKLEFFHKREKQVAIEVGGGELYAEFAKLSTDNFQVFVLRKLHILARNADRVHPEPHQRFR